MDLRITNPLDCYAPSTIGTAIWLRPPVRPDAILSQVVIAASVASRSASATGLSVRMRLMGGKRIAKIGSASCRERVCQDVYISVVTVSLKNKNKHITFI